MSIWHFYLDFIESGLELKMLISILNPHFPNDVCYPGAPTSRVILLGSSLTLQELLWGRSLH